ncbi:hypothetical protein NA56DRAFT_697668 [Hyaloscypha hepaticicola]|uniref:Uncharacterized protein n=1 Tax=Hyaloscypha hepaticicola TaxID=2082293 RepID=A0A2J6QMJ1_9HELO|nr:hypothetical protein NA56DRAFT_697668 [Hyaloscypha hepaticicola]
MLTAVALMFVGALLVFQSSETRNDDEIPSSIRPDSEVALLLFTAPINDKRVPGGRFGLATAAQPQPCPAQSTRSERAQSAQARSAATLTDAGTLAPDFLPLGIGFFIVNTRDVVTCEDAPKAL